MASTETLTSLAMLKVNIDQGKDYLEYLRPFVLQALVDHTPSPVTDQGIKEYLRTDFGLEIPSRTVQIVLKRISRSNALERSEGVYHIKGQLPNPELSIEKAKADKHIEVIVSGLLNFRHNGSPLLSSKDEAIKALCSFLSEFSIQCLKAYLRETTIPIVHGKRYAHIVLVSQYVAHIQQSDSGQFESLMVLVQGHMLANALLCPDLQNAPKSYKGVTFYLDTPLLVQRLGLEGELKKQAIEELIVLLRNLGATVAMFSHSQNEIARVLKGAAHHIDALDGRGAIVMEARRQGTTKSDLLLLAGKIDELLNDTKVEVKNTPLYIADFQIDERAFEEVLDDEISYYNPRAKEDDINSVRSIYVLREGQSPDNIEKCKAVFVTSNSAFSKAAYEYGKLHEETRDVSSVITDFSLANVAWLKAPIGAPSLPTTELLAYAYAALQPSKPLLDKYLSEIVKLEQQGQITKSDHQLLRSSTYAQEELMDLTLGEEAALTNQTVQETLRRVTDEIKKVERRKLHKEQMAHKETEDSLKAAKREKDALQQRLFWKCWSKARTCSWVISGIIFVFLIVGIFGGMGLVSSKPALGWALLLGTLAISIMTLLNLLFGTTVRQVHRVIEDRCLTYFLKKEPAAIGKLRRQKVP